jgi:L-ribulose-5-phosphate 4-epimerase
VKKESNKLLLILLPLIIISWSFKSDLYFLYISIASRGSNCKSIPNYGTTHSDYWAGKVPVTGYLKKNQLKEYEKNTGHLITELLKKLHRDTVSCPGVIVAGHGPFCWGEKFNSAVDYSEMLEFISETAYYSEQIKIKNRLPEHISKKHFERKFGKNRYYGQK